jgi:hypothetical protein
LAEPQGGADAPPAADLGRATELTAIDARIGARLSNVVLVALLLIVGY